ncbi:MAG: dNTP triphosphohydrolase, partial [Alphaproteobacteria bacterium]|nr:dNTP triphosphohydrolase [Alphaproteobacteria bacterium]
MGAPAGLAPFACKPELSRGRRYPEPESETRTPFQRDRDRVIHCAAFRRLKYKTQVFVYHEGDHYRTRLTHSLEVAQIARSVCRVLGLNEDLAEALALAHDLGHTPFGHAGEAALDEAMRPFGGFDHNAQTLRGITALEHRYADFDGLNLSWECLEGVVKHNGPLLAAAGADDSGLPAAIRAYVAEHDLELHTHAGAEAQVAALADDIAYNNHDIDDGLRAGLFGVESLYGVPLVGPVF